MNKKSLFMTLIVTTFVLTGCNKHKQDSSSPSSSEERLTGTIEERLNQLDCVKLVREVSHGSAFKKVFKMNFVQYIDHNHPELGTFNQKVELGFNDLAAPTVYTSLGYMTNDYLSYYSGENELAYLLNCNYVAVEHRYFGNSLPVKIDYNNNDTWKYLTTKQAAADAHRVVTQLKRVMEGKWLSTGASKGGMTTELFALYYPGDMDLYVPYVAPFCNSFSDKRMAKFVYEEAGDLQYGKETAQSMRESILEFQIKLLEYRDTLAPKFYQQGISSRLNYSSYTTADNLYDASVLEFAVGFWQYNQDYSSVQSCLAMEEDTQTKKTAKMNAFYNCFTQVAGPDGLCTNDEFTPYYIQAYQELGNYGYDFSYIRNAIKDMSNVELTVNESEESDLMWKLVLTEKELELGHKDLIYTRINNMLKTTDEQFIIIYGSSDPWYSVRPDDVLNRDNISIYVNDNEPHGAKISNFDTEVSEEILSKVKSILGM